MSDSDAKRLRYESNDKWNKAEELEELAKKTRDSNYKRANEYLEAAGELRKASKAEWEESKKQ